MPPRLRVSLTALISCVPFPLQPWYFINPVDVYNCSYYNYISCHENPYEDDSKYGYFGDNAEK